MIVFESRASTILYNLLRSYPIEGPFLLPTNICPIVPMVFYKAGRPFEFIDIAPDTLCMDYTALIKRFDSKLSTPAGVIYVRTYGAILDATNIFSSVKKLSSKSLIIDDRCLCSPDFNATLAPYTDAALYSTGYAKYVDIGYGGFCHVRDGIPYVKTDNVFKASDLIALTEQYQQSIREKSFFVYKDSDWLNSSDPQKTWAKYREKIEQECVLSDRIKASINSIYVSRLPLEIQFPSTYQSWRFNIQVEEKDAVLKAIDKAGLFASGHYYSLAGLFGFAYAPNASFLHRYVIQLFNDRYFSVDQAMKLTEVLSNFKGLHSGQLIL